MCTIDLNSGRCPEKKKKMPKTPDPKVPTSQL